MKILITGANGQLGKEAAVLYSKNHEVFGYGRKEMDITDLEQVKAKVTEARPDVILHAAAYTAVDQAETDADKAYQVNAFGSRNVAIAAEETGSRLCYISTDYVFDGTAQAPYAEYDPVNPQSIYGKSKRAGEELVQSLCSRYFIVRTSWVYGMHGNNFVKTMLKLAESKNQLKVVNDQIGSPTYTYDLAEFLLQLVATEKYGIYHASNTGACSWYEFAKAIFELNGISIQVDPCTTEEFPRPAPRPRYSVMDHMAIRANGFRDLRHWKDGLKDFLEKRRS
jgi:dTDP-4-dehydrorhamnose reductase